MISNKLKSIWAEQHPVLNGWLSIGNPFTAEIMAEQGYDSITIDIQHGALDYSSCLPMFQAMRGSGVVPMARVPWREPGIIMKALDAGAMGIICPMINTPEEAAEFVSFMRYPPQGQRSFGPTRANVAYGGYDLTANNELLALAMIETQAGMDNLDKIAATPGLDGIYVGPADLTLGTQNGRLAPGFDREEDEMIATIKRILNACKENGIKACLHCGTPEYAARAIEWGFDLTTVSGDSRLLAAAASASVNSWRELTGLSGKSSKNRGY
ncbi:MULTISPECIES: HpcH/HpaI aldolase family protein [Thalassospira]|uniref:2,4-dihydroxyhept-2-ene-1,7-dioic acid aldolase n=2 Tax=Thalassospira TaxID=168934 RepID=A0ABR5Y5G5_9PROT|nr:MULTISPECIES: aldolase/citrate lyase family protein [Thalassospira]HIO01196.1 2,4-dihydroxyhept-2-ene-1,7-dioic acid aldolase [Alphaproteobacteria bacterium]KZD06150.1 2,4-dihydroxyhept-2-ene-1,7-dioic acid aldolase [Thalassospira xiamenensis]KZD07562.1 2,4-dihydroxyhept-2-ene-1,7-dioic acid aldolase [Thalassospira xiamenensis]OSQ35239.1 2,4-dihydroxyhept-2-ene-1,7-dioic acid aldolase [Thalassospira sp. MCCC 1A01428]RCK42001.1 2,4-dihydroxyhept-2-ene-1,7-dioic acid aldolase [Thalassospira p